MSALLPQGFTVRPPIPDDVDAITEVFVADEEAARGSVNWDAGDTRDWFSYTDLEQNAWVVETAGRIAAVGAMAAVFFFLNSGLMAIAIALENRASAYDMWRRHAWYLGINYFAAASLATLSVGSDTALGLTGASGAVLQLNGGALLTTAGITSLRPVSVAVPPSDDPTRRRTRSAGRSNRICSGGAADEPSA